MTPAYKNLLRYITEYRKLRESTNMKRVTQQLILAYAKQITAGMPEKLWQDNIILLINECEREDEEERERRERQLAEISRRIKKYHKVRSRVRGHQGTTQGT